MIKKSLVLLASMAAALVHPAIADDAKPSYAQMKPSQYSYHGVNFSDVYQWMEKAPNESKLTRWLKAQGAVTEQLLADDPRRQKLFEQLKSNRQNLVAPYSVQMAGEYVFFRQLNPADNTRDLWVKTADGKVRMLVDQKALGEAEGEFTSINNYSVSKDGSMVAVNLAKKGAEISVVRFVKTATGEWLKDELPRIWGEFPPYFSPDGQGVFYTQMVKDGFDDPAIDKLKNMQLRYHHFGTALTADKAILGTRSKTSMDVLPKEFPGLYDISDEGHVMAFASGARSTLKLFFTQADQLMAQKPRWRKFCDVEDEVMAAQIVGNELYFIHARRSANGELKKVSLDNPDISRAEVVVPASDTVLKSLYVAKDGLYLGLMDTGIDGLAKVSGKSGELEVLDLPVKGRVSQVITDSRLDGALLEMASWRKNYQYYQYDSQNNSFATKTIGNNVKPSPVHKDLIIDRPMVTGFDGQKVPVWIIRHKDTKLTGDNPTIMNAYGGYGMTFRPYYLRSDLTWMREGGIKVIVNVRGGGAKGRSWYLDGKGKNKYKGVNDFISAAEYLIDNRYASNKTLFATGGSMGGVLIGGVLNKRPDLFAAAVISVGIVNPLRSLEGNNGANQIDEIGNVNLKAGFDAIRAMDPYNNIDYTKKYPPVMLTIGLQDQRVPSWQSGKYGAKLQTLPGGLEKTFFRVDANDGHGIGSSLDKQLLGVVDDWLFFLQMAERAKKQGS